MYKTLYIIWKIIVVECIKLCTLFKILCTLNIQNHVHSLKNFVRKKKKIHYHKIKRCKKNFLKTSTLLFTLKMQGVRFFFYSSTLSKTLSLLNSNSQTSSSIPLILFYCIQLESKEEQTKNYHYKSWWQFLTCLLNVWIR